MKSIRLCIICILGFTLQNCSPEKKTDLFPDGTKIPAWFSEVTKIKLEDLGKQFNISELGAIDDSTVIQTAIIQKAIDDAHSQGGGVVVIPKGTFLSGALFFKPKTHLHVSEGAVLKGSDNIADYPFIPSRMEGQSIDYFAALVNAYGVDGFTISGKGTIDGNGLKYWEAIMQKKKNKNIQQMSSSLGQNSTVKMLFIVIVTLFLSFHSKAEKYDFVVALDGTGNFTSIQKAIDACKAFPDSRVRIFVKNGTYKEKLVVPSCNTHLSIIGESADKTIISFGDYFDKINRGRNSTFYTYTLKVEANDFHLENITVENTAGPVGQAVALHVEGDRCVFINCRFLGNQDTVYAAGRFSRQFFLNCYVEGTTDFIFGEATALFESCALHCKANSFITAASTPEGKPFGFVFLNCKITADSGVNKVYLGRPWRSFAKVAFLNCTMGSFIVPEGWDNWAKAENEKTAVFAEYSNSGAGANRSKRVSWSHGLSAAEAAIFSRENIFAPLGWEVSKGKKWYE